MIRKYFTQFITNYMKVFGWDDSVGVSPRSLASEIKVPGLSYGVGCVILCLAVVIEYQLVTDRWTDTETHDYSIYSTALA